ncbi:MAG: ubiquinol-cytochrome C chaperone family protein [Alphaproteobacteria bacterium]|jgi:cytochrome b pre-mRNA-processing protein 3
MFNFFKKNNSHYSMYTKFSSLSRNEKLYIKFKVPDTIDGRYEMLMVNIILIIRRLKKDKNDDLAQLILDLMFSDIDQALRESGVGDLSVPKRMKKIGEAFYGRISILDQILQSKHLHKELIGYFQRNIFSNSNTHIKECEGLSEYMINMINFLDSLSVDKIIRNDYVFPDSIWTKN